MRGKEIITKLIIPGAIAMIICLIVHPMCMNGEILDWRKLLLFVGIPFGIQKMFLLVVPRNVGTGEMLGLVVLKLMVGKFDWNRGSCLEIISCSRHFAKKRHFWNYMDHKKTERNGDQK